MSQFRLARLCLMLAAAGVSAPALMTSAVAQEKPAAAAEAPKNVVRPEIFKLLDPAAIKPLMEAKNFAEVESRITQAEAFADPNPYEKYVINRMKLSLGSASDKPQMAMTALEEVIASGQLQPQEQADFILALGSMNYNAKNYKKAAELYQRYQKESATPEKANGPLIRAYYIGGDFASAKAALLPQIAATEKAGQVPSDEDLRLLASSANKVKDDATYLFALEKLVTYHPDDDLWSDTLNRGVAHKAGFDPQTNMINVYRLQAAAVKTMSADEYLDLAELALRDGFPAEAKKALDAGFAAGILGKGANAKAHSALRDKANKGAADDAKTIAKGEASAAAAKTGAGLVNLGWAYATMDQADKGIGFIERGIAKGGLKNAEEAKLRLGMAQVRAGKNDAAIQTFQGIKGGAGAGDLAKYWVMLLQSRATAK